jgi:drug/metabolite transporter (DMT)-like permease
MSEARTKILGVFLLLLFIWSSTWMFMKISVGNTPFFAASIRFFLASGILVIYQKCRSKPIGIQREYFKIYLIIGLLNFAFSYGLTYWAMSLMYSNVVSLLWATFPVQVAVFAHFSLPKERLDLARIFSLVLAVMGSAFIFNVSSADMAPEVTMGVSLVLISVAAAAFSNVHVKKFGQETDPVRLNLNGMLIGASMMLVAAIFVEPWKTFPLTFPVIGATFYLAVASSIAFSNYLWLLKHMEVTKLSYITFLIPIFAGILGWIFLEEVLDPKTLLGGSMILAAVILPDLWRRFYNRD